MTGAAFALVLAACSAPFSDAPELLEAAPVPSESAPFDAAQVEELAPDQRDAAGPSAAPAQDAAHFEAPLEGDAAPGDAGMQRPDSALLEASLDATDSGCPFGTTRCGSVCVFDSTLAAAGCGS